MITKPFLAALVSLALVAEASAAPHRAHDAAAAATGYQGEAPPWSFACMKDHGPTRCGEPMWIYGN
jgi:hypothetical protein